MKRPTSVKVFSGKSKSWPHFVPQPSAAAGARWEAAYLLWPCLTPLLALVSFRRAELLWAAGVGLQERRPGDLGLPEPLPDEKPK